MVGVVMGTVLEMGTAMMVIVVMGNAMVMEVDAVCVRWWGGVTPLPQSSQWPSHHTHIQAAMASSLRPLNPGGIDS